MCIRDRSAAVGGELKRFNTELVRQATGLGGVHAAEAAQIGMRLTEAAAVDELTIGLVSRLSDAETASTALLSSAARAAIVQLPPQPPTGTPPIGRPPTAPGVNVPPIDSEQQREAVRADAEQQLRQLSARLAADAQLQLDWTIHEVGNADS